MCGSTHEIDDDSIKRARICGEYNDKLMANDNALFSRVMRMLD